MFTTLGAVKRALRIPDVVTDNDSLIDELISSIHGLILADVGGGLTVADPTQYVQKFDVERSGFSGLRLPKWPIVSIDEVRTGTTNGAGGTVLDATEYYVVDNTPVLRLQSVIAASTFRVNGAYWPVGRQNVQVTWTVGFEQGTKDWLSLELAEKLTVCSYYNTIGAAGKASEKIGQYSYTMMIGSGSGSAGSAAGQAAYPPVAATIIARYRDTFVSESIIP